eukprot:6956325-Karenia_brevis.AAC.1
MASDGGQERSLNLIDKRALPDREEDIGAAAAAAEPEKLAGYRKRGVPPGGWAKNRQKKTAAAIAPEDPAIS